MFPVEILSKTHEKHPKLGYELINTGTLLQKLVQETVTSKVVYPAPLFPADKINILQTCNGGEI